MLGHHYFPFSDFTLPLLPSPDPSSVPLSGVQPETQPCVFCTDVCV